MRLQSLRASEMLALHYLRCLYYWDMIIRIIFGKLYNVDHVLIDLEGTGLKVMQYTHPSITGLLNFEIFSSPFH